MEIYHGGTERVMKLSDNEKKKILNEILTAAQTGTIVCRIAQRLNIPPYTAFRNFIKSNTYRIFRNPDSTYSYLGDEAICQIYLSEISE